MERQDEGNQFSSPIFGSSIDSPGEDSARRRRIFIAAIAFGCIVAGIAYAMYLRQTPYDEMVGRLKFGMTLSDVRSVLGDPDDVGPMSLPDGKYEGVSHHGVTAQYHVNGTNLPLFIQLYEENEGPPYIARWCAFKGDDGQATPSLNSGPNGQVYLQGKIVCHEI